MLLLDGGNAKSVDGTSTHPPLDRTEDETYKSYDFPCSFHSFVEIPSCLLNGPNHLPLHSDHMNIATTCSINHVPLQFNRYMINTLQHLKIGAKNTIG